MTISRCWRALAGLVSITVAACMSPSAAHQGALIGLTSGRTLWIAWPNGTARFVTEKPHLLVPRDDGMWWGGVVSRCTVGEGGGGWVKDTIFIERTDAVFVTRAGEEARVSLDGTTCEEAEREVFDLRTKERKAAPRDSLALEEEPLHPETFYCDIYSRRITFASPSVLSIEVRNIGTEFCSPAKYSTSGVNIVREFASRTRVPLRPLLAPEVSAKWERIFADSDRLGLPAENPGGRLDSSWAMRRQQGTWAAYIWIDGPIAARGGMEPEEGDVLPDSFTGYAPLPMPWSELVRQVENTRDAVASPTGDYILAQKADSLLLFRPTDGQLGAPLLSVHIGYYEELAMVRWATPDETRHWNETLPTLAPPTVRVVPSPK
jgi:hypothetical protein